MFSKSFVLNEESLAIIEQFGEHMPGGFFIYKADEKGTLLYANKAVCDIFGCADIDEFKEYTGFTFSGMIHPDDRERVNASIKMQVNESRSESDFVEYRMIRKDGDIRWIEDYGHYVEYDDSDGLYYVFISDITDKYEELFALGEYLSTLSNLKALDVLPYHDMAKPKYAELGIEYPLGDISPLSREEAIKARNIIIDGIKSGLHKQN